MTTWARGAAVMAILPLVAGVLSPAAPAGGLPHEQDERRAASTVTIAIRPFQAISGETAEVRVGVSPAVPRRVVLQRRGNRRWVNVAAARTSAEGLAVFGRRVPRADRVFRVRAPRATVRGTTYAADVSPRRTLMVQRQSVVLRAPSRVVAGEPVVVYAEAFPRRPGRPVALAMRSDDGWETVDARAQNGRGEVAWGPVFDEPGVVVLRATVLAHEGAAAVRSLTVRTTIAPAD